MPCFGSSVFHSFQNSDRPRRRLKSEKEVRSLFLYEKPQPTCKVENIKDGRGLIPEYKQVAQERLELCILLLSVMPKDELRGIVDNLKQCASAETLASEMERARGGINCWSLMQSSAKTALQEVQKAVKDTARREKKREKDAENEQKKADAKRKKEERRCRRSERARLRVRKGIHTVLADDPTQLSDDSFAAKTHLSIPTSFHLV